VSAFLRDGYVHQFLREPTKTFAPPTNQTKLDFETKTGAINVVPSPNDPYDLDTIKGDVQWLSKNVRTNEVAALRIVLIEYQSRAHSHLTGPLSTQDVANIQEAAGVGDAQASAMMAVLNATTVADAESTWADFESETTRRQRLLTTYLSERRSFLGAVDALLSFLLHSCLSDAGSELQALRDAVLQEAFGFDGNATKPDMSRLDALAPTYIRTLDDCFVRIHGPPESLDLQILTEQLQVDWVRTALTEAIHAMALTFQILDLKASHFATPEIVTQWFALMDTCEFFAPVSGGHELLAELVMPLHSLISAISLKVLNIDRTLLYLDQDVDLLEDEEPYLASSDALTRIHNTVSAAANAGLATTMPLVFAWSLILHQMHIGYQERAERRDLLQNQRAQAGFELEYEPSSTSGRQRRNSAGSIVSIEASSYDVFLASQQLERNIEPAENMARMATAQGQLYGLLAEMAVCLGAGQNAAFRPVLGARARLVFQDLLKRSVHYVGYQSEPVECLLSILSGGSQYWDISAEIPSNEKASLEIYTRMLDDDTLRMQYTSQSQSRFPYEFLPFSSICRILSAALVTDKDNAELITTLLVKTPSLTVDWDPRWDRSYELVFEEENTNSFRLTRDIDIFDATSKSNRRISPEEKSTMPCGTYGRFVTDAGRVAKLEFEHSTLALFGKRLEVNLMAGSYDTGLGYLTVDELIEGISLLATVLRAEALKSSKTDADRGLMILTEASRLLPHGKDILSIICDTLDSLVEEELADLDGPKIAALSSCLQFLYAALPVCPGRIWAYMARCALINSDTRSGRLSRITANLDMFAERYDLLLSAVKLFSSLVESAMTSAVQRKSGTSANSRAKGEKNPWLGASDKIVSRVSLSIAQTSIDVFENSATWRFPSEVDRSVLVRDVVGIMHKLVTYAHSVGPRDAPKSLTGSLAPAAGYIVESFLSTSASSLRFQPLLATLLAAFQIPDTTLYQRRAQIVSERLTTVLAFATTLLRVADYLNQASANIQTQLFKSACVVARLPAIRHSFRMPAIALLSALVESAGKSSGEPPSLLGYLGPQVSRSFIQIAGQLDQPFDRTPEVASTWKFFSTILRNRQQWMANCLLTGKTPREALKGEAKIAQLTAGSVLSTALEKLRSIRNTSSQETLAILDFFTSAQNYWPWTIFAMQRDKAFLQELRAYVRDLKAPAAVAKTDPAEACYQARIAAYIAETFAMQLYHLRQMRKEQEFAAEVVNDLDYFLRDGVAVSDYNSSLHANFARNFAQRYTGCSIDDFKRTLLVPRDLGSQYFYALDVAESMLGHDAGWAGSRHNGFRREMEAANLNLSLVEAEVVS
jgi:nuclear pore complex protein Nup188